MHPRSSYLEKRDATDITYLPSIGGATLAEARVLQRMNRIRKERVG